MTFREFECALGWEIAGRILALRAKSTARLAAVRMGLDPTVILVANSQSP